MKGIVIKTMDRPTTVSREAVRAAVLADFADELEEKKQKKRIAKKAKKV
jgi:hypothetical protein